MEERKALLEEVQRGEESVAELSRKYGVSRKTIYKWKQRVASEGEAGLVDRSRAPHQQALAVSEAKRKLILSVRHAHATWGARKIRHYLRNQNLRPASIGWKDFPMPQKTPPPEAASGRRDFSNSAGV